MHLVEVSIGSARFSFMEMEYKITMPYLGGILSDNAYKYATKMTKPIVRLWKKELAEKARALDIPQIEYYEIEVYGKFTDERRPDISNLFKVIGDGLKKTRDYYGLGVDDKKFRLVDVGYELGHLDPEIEITIRPIANIPRVKGPMNQAMTFNPISGPLGSY